MQRKLAVEGLPSTVTPDAAVYSDFENAAVPPRTGTLLGMAPVEDRPKDLFAA